MCVITIKSLVVNLIYRLVERISIYRSQWFGADFILLFYVSFHIKGKCREGSYADILAKFGSSCDEPHVMVHEPLSSLLKILLDGALGVSF